MHHRLHHLHQCDLPLVHKIHAGPHFRQITHSGGGSLRIFQSGTNFCLYLIQCISHCSCVCACGERHLIHAAHDYVGSILQIAAQCCGRRSRNCRRQAINRILTAFHLSMNEPKTSRAPQPNVVYLQHELQLLLLSS